ncbi:hypothetical protein GRI40_10710 [Altererythrobacter aerius]|uniref:Porin n=1 Tax=Tsuneonella aeria TaxID=1837929 RepID=A0A6I4TGN9_9SPHN|nr:porin [Tsuneonella aeria]MXO75688.1 hypothetical protein [Tsuneonella aeria]
MTVRHLKLSSAPLAMIAVWAAPAAAQDAAVADELARMRAQMAAMADRIDTLEAQLASAKMETQAAPPAAAGGDAKQASTAEWKGAPELTGSDGWSFKPRGRIQLDAGSVSAPDGFSDSGLGFGSELRRAFIGVEGEIPGGFGYRAEVDVAASAVEITDLYITYSPSDAVTLTAGNHKPFWGLEEMTSDLFVSFTERAALNTAFGYERRLGLSASYSAGPFVAQGGVFTDNVADLNDDGNNFWSLDGRLVFAPKIGDGQMHVGGSVHWRDLNDGADSVRYRVRPFIHTPDVRFADTGAISARRETGYGLEAAYIQGPFHATGEAHWQRVDRPGAIADPTFFGGYAEAGMFLTRGDTRGYRGGAFDRVKPANPVGEGGFGAVQVNLRYDFLDLIDAGVVGGKQDIYGVALVWTPTDFTRLMLNYGHVVYDRAALATASGDRSYAVDAVGVRAQVDF